MPFYEYKCSACGITTEALQKMSDAPLVNCPECSKPALKKLISAPAFSLKGTGWYETDFKNNTTKTAKTDDTKASSADNQKSDAKETNKDKASEGANTSAAADKNTAKKDDSSKKTSDA